MEGTMLVLAFLGMLVGLVGTIVPFLPGIPVIFITALLYGFYEGFETITTGFLLILFSLMVLAMIIDYFSGIVGAKKYGAGRQGIYGGAIGLLVGLFAFPPAGMIIFAFIGIMLGELMAEKKLPAALKAAIGVLLGFLSGLVLQLLIAIAMIVAFAWRIMG